MRDQIHSLAILLNQEENSPPSVLFMQKRLCFTRQCCKRLQNSIIGKGMEVLQHALVTPGTSTMYTDRRLFRFSISKYLVNCCILSIWGKKMFQVITLVLQLQDVCRKTDTYLGTQGDLPIEEHRGSNCNTWPCSGASSLTNLSPPAPVIADLNAAFPQLFQTVSRYRSMHLNPSPWFESTQDRTELGWRWHATACEARRLEGDALQTAAPLCWRSWHPTGDKARRLLACARGKPYLN